MLKVLHVKIHAILISNLYLFCYSSNGTFVNGELIGSYSFHFFIVAKD